MTNENIYFIAYPGGDRTKLSVCYVSSYCEYEIIDYAVASRNRWYDFDEAKEYCKKLAKDNNLIFINDNDYLD